MRINPSITAVPALLLSLSGLVGAAVVTPPKQPSNLVAKAVGVNSFLLKWKDNATDEVGYDILISVNGAVPRSYVLVPSPNLNTYTLSLLNMDKTTAGRKVSFQVRAYNVAKNKLQYSPKTSVVTVTAPSTSTFGKPTGLKATRVDDGQIRLTWKDKSSTENGYQIQYKLAKHKSWKLLGTPTANNSFNLSSTGYLPSTAYSFRVRAYKGNPVKFTAFSNEAKTTTLAFQAPQNLQVTAASDGNFTFRWKDMSSIEEGYELQRQTGTGAFAVQGTVVANTTGTTPVAFNPNTSYKFKLRGFRTVSGKRVFTSFSNTVTVKSTYLETPTSVAATAASDSSATITWLDNSKRETGYQVEGRVKGTATFNLLGSTTANIKTFTATKLIPGTNYEFRVRAIMRPFFSTVEYFSVYSTNASVLTKDGIAGNLNPPVTFGTSFVYQIDVSRASALTNLAVSTPPAGLTYNPGPRTITGTPTEEGAKTVVLTATFTDGSVITRNLVLRIVRPPADPVVAAAFTPVTIAVGATSPAIPTTGKFSDPDTLSATRFVTTKGNFDIILYSLATPLTVENFLDYVDAGRYTDTFFHRAVSDVPNKLSIVQGGGFKYTSADGFKEVTKYTTTLQNEPGVSNLEGTVAMAKIANQPNSATSQFFVNTDDVNASNLDASNEGFTVFGRVPDSGLAVVKTILALPKKAYTISGFSSSVFDTVPMNAAQAPAVMEPDKLVKVTAVTTAPILTYQLTSTNPAIATAVLNGSDIAITGVASGSTTIQVKAIDLDGSSVTQNIEVTVP